MAPLRLHEQSSLLLAAPIILIALIAWKLYRGLTGPLVHVPGPFLSKFTRWPLKIAIITGERCPYVHALHERYGNHQGPIVRIAPNETSLADIASARTIYKVGGPYYKTDWYNSFTGRQSEGALFTMTDPKEHGIHRRFHAFNFSEKWISNMEPFIARNVKLAVDRMVEECNAQGYFDAFKWFMFMATDVIGEASFGESFEILRTGQKNQYIKDLEHIAGRNVIRAEFFTLINILQKVFPIGPVRDIQQAVARMGDYAQESLDRYWRKLQADPDNTKPTLLTKVFAGVQDGTVSLGQIRRDAMSNIIAGTDTTAVAATNAVFLLSQHRDIEYELIREVATLPSGFTDEDLRSLTLLGNVINETLRFRGSVLQGLPRFVPPGGAEFCGYFIPQGQVVGVQAYTMHIDPKVWAHPQTFDPSRWNKPTKEMLHSFYPFGGGSRVCIGSHFAQLELRYALANFYRTFEGGVKMSNAEGFSEEDMVQKSYFLQPPKGKRCLLQRRK